MLILYVHLYLQLYIYFLKGAPKLYKCLVLYDLNPVLAWNIRHLINVY